MCVCVCIQTRLNIQEIALPASGSAAPSSGAAGADGADEAGAEEAAPKPKEKMIFNVKLESFDAGVKPKVIKEVKALVPNLTLIEVRSPPTPPSFPKSVLISLSLCLPPLF